MIQFVIQIEKKKDWLHQQHAWSIPLLKIPGIKLTEVRNDGVLIKRSTYRVDYRKRLLIGHGVQHFDLISVQLCLTHRLSAWSNVILTSLVGLLGMIILFFIPFTVYSIPTIEKTSTRDSVRSHQNEASKDSVKPIEQRQQTAKTYPVAQPSYINNTSAVNRSTHREIIVAIAVLPDSSDMSGNSIREDFSIEQDIVDVFKKKSYEVYTSFFTPSFYTNGAFRQVMSSNFSTVSLTALQARADELCIGTVRRHSRQTVTLKNLFVTEIEVQIKIYSLETGKELRRVDKTVASQAAFTAEQALTQAHEALTNFLNTTL